MNEVDDLTVELLDKREERLQHYARSWLADEEYRASLHQFDEEVLPPRRKYAR